MAEADFDQESGAPPPAIAPALAHAAAPWLAPLRDQLRGMRAQGRVPHGVLFAGPPGAGQAELGLWLAGELLCRSPGGGRCGECADCRLFLAGNHPDFGWLRVAEKKKEISVEQVRTLSERLSMRSYRGGAKLALIDPAEAMNIHSFNALLKTLEEPSPDTYLILATSRADRIPRTIVSRCTRIALPLPGRSEALAWLAAAVPRPDWSELLALAHGAPFLALEHAEAGLADLDRQMREAIEAAALPAADLVGLARTWAEDAPVTRLLWLDSWLAGELKAAALGSDAVNNNRLPWLRGPGRAGKIRLAYRLLDRLREARRLAGGSLNLQLLFEGLLVSLAALLRTGTQRGQE